MLPDIHRATQKFYIFLIVYLTGCTPSASIFVTLVAAVWMFAYALASEPCSEATNIEALFSSRASVLPNKLNSPSSYHGIRTVLFLRFESHTPMPLL